MTNNDVRSKLKPQPTAIAVAVSMLLLGTGAGAATAAPAPPAAAVGQDPAQPGPAAPAPALTNLGHLDFLMDTVPLAPAEGHTTYRLDQMPSAQAPWTYADKKADGTYSRIGGGELDPATGHWSQGA
jgi:hypothetical protein